MYYFLKFIAAIVSSWNDSKLEKAAKVIAYFFFDIMRIRRRTIVRNLEIAFGDRLSNSDRLSIGRQSVYHFSLSILETLHSYRNDIAANIEIKGLENLKTALEKGRGAYILCFHMGNWEAMASVMTRTITPSYVIVKKVGSKGVNRFVEELRDKNSFLFIKREKKGDVYRSIKEILSRNQIVGFVIDQARPGEPKLPFFSHPAKTNTSFAAIWRRLRSPIIPGYIYRTGPGVHVLNFLPEIKPVISDNLEKDLIDHSILFNLCVEKVVSEKPEQYFWMHDRWKE
ncbi:MAG: lysophospholipid acyltransferase family protein [Oligoflexales bacterium]|nr:lysophospholipid acyltransferase family protein [Oligoflexales bacterium]